MSDPATFRLVGAAVYFVPALLWAVFAQSIWGFLHRRGPRSRVFVVLFIVGGARRPPLRLLGADRPRTEPRHARRPPRGERRRYRRAARGRPALRAALAGAGRSPAARLARSQLRGGGAGRDRVRARRPGRARPPGARLVR